MSEPPATEGSTTQSDGNTTTVPNPPAHSSAPTNTPPALPDFSGITTQLAALPEQIAKSVREAIGTPKTPDKPADKPEEKAADKPTETAKPTETVKPTTPGKKSFRDWWFD